MKSPQHLFGARALHFLPLRRGHADQLLERRSSMRSVDLAQLRIENNGERVESRNGAAGDRAADADAIADGVVGAVPHRLRKTLQKRRRLQGRLVGRARHADGEFGSEATLVRELGFLREQLAEPVADVVPDLRAQASFPNARPPAGFDSRTRDTRG